MNLDTLQRLEELIAESHTRPIFVFKHSNSCGISHDVLTQMEALDHEVHVIVVQESRAISDAVANKLGTRHASPQAFVLKDGKPVYHATHYGIDPEKILEHLQ
jgi:bacillithiol system protein YtxJ